MKPFQASVLTAGLAAVLTIGLVGCENATKTAAPKTTQTANATQSVTFFVEGMV
ncbi:MAG: hypothetical protein AB8B55_09640 [Mariniblastus sp.]